MNTVFVNAHDFTPRQRRAAQVVLDSLDRVEERLITHYSRKRRHDRKNYRGLVAIAVPMDPLVPAEDRESWFRFDVWARNISRSGLAFIHPGELVLDRLMVGLNAGQPNASWFTAESVRSQSVQYEFWEYGVRFTGRAEI